MVFVQLLDAHILGFFVDLALLGRKHSRSSNSILVSNEVCKEDLDEAYEYCELGGRMQLIPHFIKLIRSIITRNLIHIEAIIEEPRPLTETRAVKIMNEITKVVHHLLSLLVIVDGLILQDLIILILEVNILDHIIKASSKITV